MDDMSSTESSDGDVAPAPPTRANQLVRRGFDGVTMAHENAATQALIAAATASIQARWVMAMRNPRDMNHVRQLVLSECERPQFAAVAMYAVPRAGKMITGLSIRFAEVAMRCMGNMAAEAQTLYDSDEERVVQISTTDFESNALWSRHITVKKTVEKKQIARNQRPIRTRTNSYGDVVYIVHATDDEVSTKEASAISKASRTGILRLIPGNIQDEAKRAIEATMLNKAAQDPAAERNRMFDAFADIGVMPVDVAKLLGHTTDRISPPELVWLRQVFVGINNGDTNIGDAIASAETGRAARATATTSPAAAAKPAAANGNGAKAEAAPTGPAPEAKASPATATGKGTQSAKEKIRGDAKASAPATKKEPEPAKAEPAPEPAKTETTSAPPPPGFEERECGECSAKIDVPIGDPPGAICYACSQA